MTWPIPNPLRLAGLTAGLGRVSWAETAWSLCQRALKKHRQVSLSTCAVGRYACFKNPAWTMESTINLVGKMESTSGNYQYISASLRNIVYSSYTIVHPHLHMLLNNIKFLATLNQSPDWLPSGNLTVGYWKSVEIVDLPINSMVDLSIVFVCLPGGVELWTIKSPDPIK